ncbi:hypothetical protein [Candidatus Korobacter versatilis]|uniref:hypothetical protein n=1 Tax=Candidatus Korobacter versatilis TaxID=658062 RepID=UPI0005A49384|nr:hypothetical protein [Candidatus Koribacter versatilis]
MIAIVELFPIEAGVGWALYLFQVINPMSDLMEQRSVELRGSAGFNGVFEDMLAVLGSETMSIPLEPFEFFQIVRIKIPPKFPSSCWMVSLKNDGGTLIQQCAVSVDQVCGVGEASPNGRESLLFPTRLAQDDRAKCFPICWWNVRQQMNDVIDRAGVDIIRERGLYKEVDRLARDFSLNLRGLFDAFPIDVAAVMRPRDREPVVLTVPGFRSTDIAIAAGWIAHHA